MVDLSQKAIHLGEDVGYRVEARVPNGSGVAWVNLRKRNQYDSNGLATVGLIAIQDVSELRQTEADLRSQHHRLRQILAAAQAGTWDWHLEDNSIVWSDESYELFGLSTTVCRGVWNNALILLLKKTDHAWCSRSSR